MKLPMRTPTTPTTLTPPPGLLVSLVAAAAISLATVPSAALASPLDDFQNRIQANMEKTDFAERNAKFQADLANLQTTVKSVDASDATAVQESTKAALSSASSDFAARIKSNMAAADKERGRSNTVSLDLEEIKAQAAARTQANLAKAQSKQLEATEKAKAALAADAAVGSDRFLSATAEGASGLVGGIGETVGSVAQSEALKSLVDDAADGSERAQIALKKAQEADVKAQLATMQESTKAALSEQIGAVGEGAAAAVDATAKQLEVAKAGTVDLAAKTGETLQTVTESVAAPPSVDLQLDKKVAAFQAAGQASLEKAQRAAAEDTERMQAQAARAQEKLASSTATLGDTVGSVLPPGSADGQLAAQAAAAIKGSSSNAVVGLQQAAEAKKLEVARNIQKTNFQQRYAKFQKDVDSTKGALESTKQALESGDATDIVKGAASKVGESLTTGVPLAKRAALMR